MVTSEVLSRTVFIKCGKAIGTAFLIDDAGRRYVVTAAHVLGEFASERGVEVHWDGSWRNVRASLIGQAEPPCDIAVLALDTRIGSDLALDATSVGMYVGQEVFLVGYPFGLFTDGKECNAGWPIPFVKRGTLSAFAKQGNTAILYLDAHNNPGFSGGPVVYRDAKTNTVRVGAVIAGFLPHRGDVYRQKNRTSYEAELNSGIVVTYDIFHALEVIRSNPQGYNLSQS